MTIRRLAELASRRVVLRRRLPSDFDHAPVYVSPDASLRYWLPNIERISPELLSWVRELVRPGDTVWDVGANVGVFATAAAQRAGSTGSVVLIEPDPWLCGLLARTVAAQERSAPMTVVNAAAGEHEGEVKLLIAARGRSANFVAGAIGSSQAGGARVALSVPLVSLDGLSQRHTMPHLVKIDVEGSEAAVLQGSQKLLASVRPRVLCEVSVSAAETVARLFVDARYLMFDASLPAASRTPISSPAWNTLALPHEQFEPTS